MSDSPLGIAGSGPEGLLCPQHMLQERPRCSERGREGEPPQPNNNNNKKAVVFKPPLRFPAPGASPLHKIKQPGVCFISPPAAHPPWGRSRAEALSRTRLLRPGCRAQGGAVVAPAPRGPCGQASPHGQLCGVFLSVCFA